MSETLLLREIEDKILLKSWRKDKNFKDYLILELENGEKIFVFDNSKTPQDNWDFLIEEGKYTFTVKEGKLGINILTEFKRHYPN